MVTVQERYENLVTDLNFAVTEILKDFEINPQHPFFTELTHYYKNRLYNQDIIVDFDDPFSVTNFVNQYINDVNLLLKKSRLPFDLLLGDEANNFYYANMRTEKKSVLEVFDPKRNFILKGYEEMLSPQIATEFYVIDLNNDNLLSALSVNLSLRGTHFYFDKLIDENVLEQCSLAPTKANHDYLIQYCVDKYSSINNRDNSHISNELQELLLATVSEVSQKCGISNCFSLVKDPKTDMFLFYPLYKLSDNKSLSIELNNDETLYFNLFSRMIPEQRIFDELKKVVNSMLCSKYEIPVLQKCIQEHAEIMSNENSKERFIYQHKDLEVLGLRNSL